MRLRKSGLLKFLCVFTALNILTTIVWPTVTYALTAGPSAPEFSTFTPVATTDMVNVFTGDFNYNLPVIEVPGSDGGGYALSLSYNSGVSLEQEASWVGFGWTLNPGSINRSVRVFPDDYKGEKVDFYNKTRPNWTTAVTNKIGLEAFAKQQGEDPRKSLFAFNGSNALRFNNYSGFFASNSFGIDVKGYASLSANHDPNNLTFTGHLYIDPLEKLSERLNTDTQKAANKPENTTEQNNTQIKKVEKEKFQLRKELQRTFEDFRAGKTYAYGLFSFSEIVKNTAVNASEGFMYNWDLNVAINPTPWQVGVYGGASGSFSLFYNREYKADRNVYGYLHSDQSSGSIAGQMTDYHVEKSSTYNQRDVFVGIPFSTPDIFMVNGEGIGGGFRAYPQKVGHFAPNKVTNTHNIQQLGIQPNIGVSSGIGINLGVGLKRVELDDWGVTDSFVFDGQPFRFNHDKGGKVMYSANLGLSKARINAIKPFPGAAIVSLNTPNDISNAGYIGKSSYIEQVTDNPEKITGTGDGIIGKFIINNQDGLRYTYGRPTFIRNETTLSIGLEDNLDLSRRHYAFRDLPLTKSIMPMETDDYEVAQSTLHNSAFKTIVGEIRNEPYANNYLLTAITTPDYIDINNDNVPGEGDFGGWTKFDYVKKYGEGDNLSWYRYRMPYRGLLYQQNSISSKKDDVGSVLTGEKEIQYLKTVETKTHIAYFVTNEADFSGEVVLNGSTDPKYLGYLTGRSKSVPPPPDLQLRQDGYGAADLGADDPYAQRPTVQATENANSRLEYLDKIVLFAKEGMSGTKPIVGKPIKVVRFAYDYTLVPNVPNNKNSLYAYSETGGNNTQDMSGKLTLKKVWFEYEGTVPAKISPYEFDYLYKNTSRVENEDLHRYFVEYDDLSENVQNPPYSAHLMDPWGNVMLNAEERKEDGIIWIDQGFYVDPPPFDPAAWQLKSIKLPSGGEILIQYEQKDYQYVQDRGAMAMASLKSGTFPEGGYETDPVYTINVQDLGVDPTNEAEVRALRRKIMAIYNLNDPLEPGPLPVVPVKNQLSKIYFKFLYALSGNYADLDLCTSEYITGYAELKSVSVVQNGSNWELQLLVGSTSSQQGFSASPRTACYDFVVNNRQGKLNGPDCEAGIEVSYDDLMAQAVDNVKKGIFRNRDIRGIATNYLFPYMMVQDRINVREASVCRFFNPELSFFKLPMLRAKKGGGVRVKRLLMYDSGIETGDEVVYGTRYRYVLEDGVSSSGVATNEPAPAREENPLVRYLPRKTQSVFSRFTAGQDTKQVEGPIGESILPNASVGHSRVVVENIHTGKTGTGFTVHEYNTVKDYPYDMYYGVGDEGAEFETFGQGVDITSLPDNTERDKTPRVPFGIASYQVNKVWMNQGFRFIINNMHGTAAKMAGYGGVYDDVTDGVPDVEDEYLVSMQEYDYYEPGEKVPMMKYENGQFTSYKDTPGIEMEVSQEARRVRDFIFDLSIHVNITFAPVKIDFGVAPLRMHFANESIATHAISKVIRYPVLMKGITTYQDGIFNKQENLAFGETTGNPVLTKTTDSFHGLNNDQEAEHDGSIYNFSIPAHWIPSYAAMGPKSQNINNTNQLSAITGSFVTYQTQPGAGFLTNPGQILNASIQTFADGWDESWADEKIKGEYGLDNNKANQLKQIWRPEASFVYRNNLDDKDAGGNPKKIYDNGYYTIGQMFDWTADINNQPDPNWIKVNEVTKYSPHGNALEEINVLNIPSAAVFSNNYENRVPTMIAQNAGYSSIYFEDFENTLSTGTKAHSGDKSKRIDHGEEIISGIFATPQLGKVGALLNVWLNFEDGQEQDLLVKTSNNVALPLEKVARTGDWILYQANIDKTNFGTVAAPINISISAVSGSFDQNIHMDDVRFQPYDAQATCYVYDKNTLRLITQFDDQHFGLFYQYNGEGQLVRKLIETERGMKTIQETQYNTPSQLRIQ